MHLNAKKYPVPTSETTHQFFFVINFWLDVILLANFFLIYNILIEALLCLLF